MVARQVRHLDTIDIQRRSSDQLFRHNQRLRRIVRLNVDLMLKAFEVVSVGVQQILVEGNTVSVHDTFPLILRTVAELTGRPDRYFMRKSWLARPKRTLAVCGRYPVWLRLCSN